MNMPRTTLTISGTGEPREIGLEPKGYIIGRSPDCGIFLDSEHISRQHGRIFQDPFGRWIIEDLGSRNGIWINGQRIKARAILPGEKISIPPFTLSIVQPLDRQIPADPLMQTTTAVMREESKTEILPDQEQAPRQLSGDFFNQLNEIIDLLSELTGSRELYPQVCRSLAERPDTMAAVLRLLGSPQPLSEHPQILACCLGGDTENNFTQTPANFHISRRVLEAVRTGGHIVVARSVPSQEKNLTLTIIDENRPRTVLCGPVTSPAETLDVLYLDIPEDRIPSGMVNFLQAVIRQVDFARRSLLFSETKAERQVLDKQLSMAREIQTKLTPSKLPKAPGVDIAVWYQPAMWVGGDYCDVWSLANGSLAFALGDVSGKGLPAAMVMSNLQAALRTTMAFCGNLSQAIRHVNQHMLLNLPEGMFITLFTGIFDAVNGKLDYVNAGHILPLIIHPAGDTIPLGEPANPPLGVSDKMFEMESELIKPNTGLFVVTDGITEARSPEGEEFGTERLMALLQKVKVASAEYLIRTITGAVSDFRKTLAQHDDVTALALLHRGSSQGKA